MAIPMYEHLGVRGQVNGSPTVDEVVWTVWQAFLNQPGVNMHPAMPNGGGEVAAGWEGQGRCNERHTSWEGQEGCSCWRTRGWPGERVEAGGRSRGMRGVIKVLGMMTSAQSVCYLSVRQLV